MDGTLSTSYRTHDVPVRGGDLRVGAWGADRPAERVVLAVHGITSSHRAWTLVGERLAREPGTLVLAPDLRGRARSADLPGPYGMAQHAEDLVAVLDALAGGRCDVVAGHSMGGFVAVVFAAQRPDLLNALVLVDGGVPLLLPPGWTLQQALEVGLGPAAERLRMSFPDREAYLDFWRAHPAFAEDFSETVRDYVDYDLAPDGPPWRSGCRVEAMTADHVELFEGSPVDAAWSKLTTPAVFLRAPRGLQDEPGGLYSPQRLDDWAATHSAFDWRDVDGVNHYTITMGVLGADAVTAAVDGCADPAGRRTA
jgi:pimeloyl-ACP methyl ester carboxylesterase